MELPLADKRPDRKEKNDETNRAILWLNLVKASWKNFEVAKKEHGMREREKKRKINSIKGSPDEVLCRPSTIARLGQGPCAPGLQVVLTLRWWRQRRFALWCSRMLQDSCSETFISNTLLRERRWFMWRIGARHSYIATLLSERSYVTANSKTNYRLL